ncbi:MBL fold metallo-hydrolase [Teichococcus oryzae]|uniref:MBL fold metallo-hydrolase n=1 Tax=Teichococcus oryzae TaxID=1608942 RepID=UPI001F4FEE03|nr:MBL fold metallo-hydrolase [Pseudoroseomonas oryzae]
MTDLPPPRGAARRGKVFLNPDGSLPGQPLSAVWRMMREGRGTPWPGRVENPPFPPPPEPSPGEVVVTFIGHASFLIRYPGGPALLTDPIWSERCSPFRFAGPKRVRAPGLAFEALPKIDTVLLSHNHYDHCDIPTLKRLQQRDAPRIVTGLGNGRLLARHGMRDVVELDWWQEARLPGGVTACFTPARHFAARGLHDRAHALWGGFALRDAAGTSLCFTGDSGWGAHFEEIGQRRGPFDMALIPIGAYEPRWFMQAVHINPEEAVRAFQDLRAKRALAMHFGTFKLTQEAIDAPAEALSSALRAAGLAPEAFRVPGHGESVLIRPAPG